MRVTNTPFTVYDFIGYFVPGVLLISYVVYEFCNYNIIMCQLFGNHDKTLADEVFCLFGFICICYIIGHLNSFLSNFFIQDIVRLLFSAPSEYLMMNEKEQSTRCNERIWNKVKSCIKESEKDKNFFNFLIKPSLSIIRFAISFPLSFLLCIFKKSIRSEVFSSPMYKEKNKHLIRTLNVFLINREIFLKEEPPTNDDMKENKSRFLVVAKTLRYEEEGGAIYNYLTLSGCFRSLAFLCLSIGWSMIFSSNISSKFLEGYQLCAKNESFFYFSFGFLKQPIILVLFSWTLAFLFTLIYMKFDRRYAEEIFVATMHNNAKMKKKNG